MCMLSFFPKSVNKNVAMTINLVIPLGMLSLSGEFHLIFVTVRRFVYISARLFVRQVTTLEFVLFVPYILMLTINHVNPWLKKVNGTRLTNLFRFRFIEVLMPVSPCNAAPLWN